MASSKKNYALDTKVLTVYKSPFSKIRLGKDYDGGYIIADIPDVDYSLLISGGISDDISFEEDFCDKYSNVKCFAYDASTQISSSKNKNIVIKKKYIGNTNRPGFTNLHNLINDRKENIFLKMDIEGGEIPWLKCLSNEQLNKFSQIAIEFHRPFTKNEISVFDKINKNHILIHFHGNNCGKKNSKNYKGEKHKGFGCHQCKGVFIPGLFECTYLHKKYFTKKPELNTDPIPSPLDMPNAKEHYDININWEPFVNK